MDLESPKVVWSIFYYLSLSLCWRILKVCKRFSFISISSFDFRTLDALFLVLLLVYWVLPPISLSSIYTLLQLFWLWSWLWLKLCLLFFYLLLMALNIRSRWLFFLGSIAALLTIMFLLDGWILVNDFLCSMGVVVRDGLALSFIWQYLWLYSNFNCLFNKFEYFK